MCWYAACTSRIKVKIFILEIKSYALKCSLLLAKEMLVSNWTCAERIRFFACTMALRSSTGYDFI